MSLYDVAAGRNYRSQVTDPSASSVDDDVRGFISWSCGLFVLLSCYLTFQDPVKEKETQMMVESIEKFNEV